MNLFLQSEGGLCLMIMIPHGRKSLHQSMMGGWGLMERWISLLHYGGETRDKCMVRSVWIGGSKDWGWSYD